MEKILIIDDMPLQAGVLRSILEDGYDVTTVNSAEEGFLLARSGAFSLVLMDVVMPDIDGFSLLKQMQEESVTKHIPVIMITSLSDTQNEARGLTLGAVDYIAKPFNPLIVKTRVNTHIKLYQYRTQMEHQVMIDQLTGVSNRRYYDTQSISRWQDAIRLRVPISICMFDIDKFKVYNDTFGHGAGDKVISSVASTAASFLRRSTDVFARYGGEEFVALLLGNSAESAYEYVRKIRRAIEDLQIPHNPEVSPYVTVSVGGVTVRPKVGDNYETYLKISDTMLYDAKRFGRNQVVWSNEKMERWQEAR